MNRKGGGGQQRCYLHLNLAKGSVSQRSYARNNSTSTRFPQNRTTEPFSPQEDSSHLLDYFRLKPTFLKRAIQNIQEISTVKEDENCS